MNTLPTAQERRSKAFLHEQEMIEKYTAVYGPERALNFHSWWKQVEYDSNGKVTLGYHRDFPLPYGNYYLQHFIETYFSQGSENNLIFNLENQFIGDEIDAEYIETLFISIKDLGLFTPKSILILNDSAGSMTTYAPLADGLEYVNIASTHNVASSSVFEGSELNLERAEIIRRWLNRRNNELSNNNSIKHPNGRTLSPDTKQLAPALIKKEGRLFVLCLEGELETTVEELAQQNRFFEYFDEYSQVYRKLYSHQKWTLAQVPKEAEMHIKMHMFFNRTMKFFQKQYDKGKTLWTSYKMCDIGISTAKHDLSAPYNNKTLNEGLLAGWTAMREFLDLFPKRGIFDETPPFTPPAPSTKNSASSPSQDKSTGYPWEEIDALAHKIGLLKAGEFTLPGNRIAAAVAGLIDALREAGTLPVTTKLPSLYEDFTQHYGRKISADRATSTRTDWRQKARRELKLDSK